MELTASYWCRVSAGGRPVCEEGPQQPSYAADACRRARHHVKSCVSIHGGKTNKVQAETMKIVDWQRPSINNSHAHAEDETLNRVGRAGENNGHKS